MNRTTINPTLRYTRVRQVISLCQYPFHNRWVIRNHKGHWSLEGKRFGMGYSANIRATTNLMPRKEVHLLKIVMKNRTSDL
jgi:hypothetical protein